MFKMDLEKAEESDIKWLTFMENRKKQGNSRKAIYFCFSRRKALIVWITTNWGKFLKGWE